MKKPNQNASALTLIEVVAALTLVATSVTALLAAQGRSLEQLRSAQELETAATLARELIIQWRLDPLVVPPLEGEFIENPKWRWRRKVGATTDHRATDLQEIMLTIYRRDNRGVEQRITSYIWLEKTHASGR